MSTERQTLPSIHRLVSQQNGFLEIENARGDLATLRWRPGGFSVEEGLQPRAENLTADAVVSWTRSFLRRTRMEPAARPGGEPGVQGHPLDATCTLETEGGAVADGLSDWQLQDELDQLGPSGENRFAVLRRGVTRGLNAEDTASRRRSAAEMRRERLRFRVRFGEAVRRAQRQDRRAR